MAYWFGSRVPVGSTDRQALKRYEHAGAGLSGARDAVMHGADPVRQ